jgi:hypothetical protein
MGADVREDQAVIEYIPASPTEREPDNAYRVDEYVKELRAQIRALKAFRLEAIANECNDQLAAAPSPWSAWVALQAIVGQYLDQCEHGDKRFNMLHDTVARLERIRDTFSRSE